MGREAVVAIYTDADFYPPTISALLNIAEEFEIVHLVCRNNAEKDYPFPPNVSIKKIGSCKTVRQMEVEPLYLKIIYFFRFSFRLLRLSARRNNGLIVIFDPIALFGFYLFRPFYHKKKIWYHNHDMPDSSFMGWSLGAMAARFEKKALKSIFCFSLPQQERLKFYPNVNKPCYIIPNYPSLKVYAHASPDRPRAGSVKIIYQGFIGEGIGIELYLPLLKKIFNSQSVKLLLKGSVTDAYKTKIMDVAQECGVAGQIEWLPIGPYSQLPQITSSCNLGSAINLKTDIVSRHKATASNKIYEYAACGLPVIVNNSPELLTYLSGYKWVYFTDTTPGSLESVLEKIISSGFQNGKLARQEFENVLNFEKKYLPVLHKILTDPL